MSRPPCHPAGICRYPLETGGNTRGTGPRTRAFGDAGTVFSEWARDAVLWCQQAGVMAGRSGDKLAPEDTITTAEALVMLERAAGLPDVGQLRDDLEILAAHHRPVAPRGRPMQSGI